jgi:hypothetical protein
MTEDFVRLNSHEISILLSALQSLTVGDHEVINKDYGSAPALYNKLYSIYEEMYRPHYKLTPPNRPTTGFEIAS